MWGAIFDSTWLNTLVIAIGVAIAVVSILSAHGIAKRRETSQALFASRSNRTLQAGIKRIVVLYADTNQNLTAFAGKRETQECKLILFVLNHWEYVAVSIKHGIFDDKMYREASYTTAIELYRKTRNFVDELRKIEDRATIFQEFQKLAERWEKKPLVCIVRKK